MSEIQFAKGVYFSEKPTKAPSYVLGKIAFKKEEVIAWLQTFDDEYVNCDVFMSKGGKPYVKLNTYKKGEAKPTAKPVEAEPTIEYPTEDISPKDIPF